MESNFLILGFFFYGKKSGWTPSSRFLIPMMDPWQIVYLPTPKDPADIQLCPKKGITHLQSYSGDWIETINPTRSRRGLDSYGT